MSEKNLAQRILSVMSEVQGVTKKGFNNFHKYSYAKESDYIEAIRPALIKHGIVVIPSLVSERSEPQNDGMLTSIVMKFTVINADNIEDKFETHIPAQGSDKGDKGVYKAITGAKKYFVSNTFLIPTNEDAEDDASDFASSKQSKPPVAAAPVKKAEESVASKPVQQFSKTTSPASQQTSKGGW